MPHLYLVDGSGYIFRANHRLPPLTNKHGEHVGAVYGYTTLLRKLADELHKADGPTHMAVILDNSSHTFRNELYYQYKAHRPPPPEDLVPQFPMIRDATRAFSLPCIEEEGLEADDIIACYTQAALAQGWSVTIVSSDKDLMQLMTDPSVDLYDTMNNRRLGPDHVMEKFGVGPDKLGDVLALMGDSVDNVPGVTGVDVETLERWIAAARYQGFVAIDTETTGVDATRAELVGVSMALEPNRACYIPLGHGGADMFAEEPVQLDRAVALAKLKPLLEDPGVLKIGHNLKYDLIVLGRCGIEVAPYDDTIVMSFNLDAGLHGHGMDELAATHLSHSCIAYKDVVGTGKKQLGFHEVDLKAATRYAAEDADVTLRLWRRFKPRLPAEQATRVYEMVERALPAVIGRMERHGVKVDQAKLHQLSTDFAHQLAALEEEVHALAGFKFTIGSPKQLGDVLFDKMGIKGGRKGKSGVYSTDVTELARIAAYKDSPGLEMLVKVLDWRQLPKLKNTYTDALQDQINPTTGRVHTSYSLTGAQTGRLSSTDPNLQNIPIRTETGRQIRDAFVAEPGNVILAADYSQLELRLAAHIADVPQLKDAFARADDIHALTAQELFGEVTRDTRGRAKTINFAILYGISRWGLAGRLDVTADEAQAMIDRYFERFPGIRNYIANTISQVRERSYTETLFGRKTHFPRIKSSVQHERQGAERAAINAPIQGTSADIIKRAMARMEPALASAGLTGTRMLLQVHDELVFEVPEGEVDAAKPVIERVMATAAEPAMPLSVPLAIDIGTGPSWGAAH